MSVRAAFFAMARWAGTVFNLRGIWALGKIPRYVSDWMRFTRASRIPVRFRDSYPCLADATAKTPFDAHYFFQGAWLARKLFQRHPPQHIDIGSDVNVVGVMSAFVDTIFVDYRPLAVRLPGLENRQGDVLHLKFPSGSVDSLSCLHVIEHIGLGRYGDSIDAEGATKAAVELSRVLAPGGSLYLSVPIGHERVCFNAHRVFSPDSVVRLFPDLQLMDSAMVDDAGAFHEHVRPEAMTAREYGCGMFHFVKPQGAGTTAVPHP